VATERPVVRYRRPARLLHAATYLVTLLLLYTGWRITSCEEGHRSVVARLLDRSDPQLHRQAGWALVVVAGVAVTLGIRGAVTFVRETARVDRGDGRWFLRWPIGALTGRFAHHRGHFDPGQRLANVAFVGSFGTLVVTGVGLTTVAGGPTYATLVHVHRAATWALAVTVAVHLVMALGILPGYRGAWRSMHLGGRTPAATVRRLWPATLDVPSARSDDPPVAAGPRTRPPGSGPPPGAQLRSGDASPRW
jgi:formate dehydrogenase subunit gamma